ncbi:MAG: GNAT family N-acetyltransferase [Ignavibacteriae bacterium]|nr:GNAT family N-acetyltransferase [Ignavibacteriota bacterium]MCB9214379.1 GNAT family N-acetyltransferase [Ignavibacteria bacterium]
MNSEHYPLKNGDDLHIRQAEPEDAASVINYIEAISGESDFLSMGPGEFEVSVEEEVNILRRFRDAENQLFILGLVGDQIVASLSFSSRNRPRLQHTGSFGMSVRKDYWGFGIGGLMLDTLLSWARETGIITKINLHVRPDNDRALQLYLSRGFAVEGRLSRTMCINGAYHDSLMMGLKID